MMLGDERVVFRSLRPPISENDCGEEGASLQLGKVGAICTGRSLGMAEKRGALEGCGDWRLERIGLW